MAALLAGRPAAGEPTSARRALVAMAAGSAAVPAVGAVVPLPDARTPARRGAPGQARAVFDTVTALRGRLLGPGAALGLLFFGLIGLALFGAGRRRPAGAIVPSTSAAGRRPDAGRRRAHPGRGHRGRPDHRIRLRRPLRGRRVPPVLLLVALGTATIADPRVCPAVAGLAVVLGFATASPTCSATARSGRVAAAIAAGARPGRRGRLLPRPVGPVGEPPAPRDAGLAQLTFPRATSPQLVDWVDYETPTGPPAPAVRRACSLDRAGPTHDIWLVWAPGYRTFGTKCQTSSTDLDDARPDNHGSSRCRRSTSNARAWSGSARLRPGEGAEPTGASGPRTLDVVIIGAGPAGLTAAYQLGKQGLTSTVLEADTVVGGISRTAERDGWRFDIGGHRFFTKVQAVEDLWHEILPDDEFLLRPRMSRIYYNGKFFDYPLKPMNALKNLGVVEAVAVRGVLRLGPGAPAQGPDHLRGLDDGPLRLAASTASSSRPTPRRCGACRPPRSRPTGPPSASRTCRWSRR